MTITCFFGYKQICEKKVTDTLVDDGFWRIPPPPGKRVSIILSSSIPGQYDMATQKKIQPFPSFLYVSQHLLLLLSDQMTMHIFKSSLVGGTGPS